MINRKLYNNVTEMVADSTLQSGMVAETLGYYTANDLGGAKYIIGTTGDIALGDELKAQIVIEPQMNVECFGARGNGTYDDSSAIALASSYNTQIKFGRKNYLIASAITINNDVVWIGDNTVFTLQDVDSTRVISINGNSDIRNIKINWECSYITTEAQPYSITAMRISTGAKHSLKNVDLNITQPSGVDAEANGIWYNFMNEEDSVHTLMVDNCVMSNLSTGHDSGTGCLWGTGIFDRIVVKNSSFTRNHSGDIVTFWGNDEKETIQNIDNILVDNCTFYATNDVAHGAACLQFGNTVEKTVFDKINVINTKFFVSDGFGSACVSCSTSNTTLNIEGCEFYKSYVAVDGLSDYQMRLEVTSLQENCKVNLRNCKINNVNNVVYITDLRNASATCDINIYDSEISAYSNIYSGANINYYRCKISIADTSGYTYLKTPTNYLVKTTIADSQLDCQVQTTYSFKLTNSVCTKPIYNNINSTDADIYLGNNVMQNYNLTLTSSQLDDLTMKNNEFSSLVVKSSDITVPVSNISSICESTTFVNNIYTPNREMLADIIV